MLDVLNVHLAHDPVIVPHLSRVRVRVRVRVGVTSRSIASSTATSIAFSAAARAANDDALLLGEQLGKQLMTSPLLASSATSAPGASGCPLLASSERDERLARPSLPDNLLPDWLPRGETHLVGVKVRVRVSQLKPKPTPKPKPKPRPKP